MNGIEKIADRIMDESDREIAEILEKAKQDAENIKKRYDAEAHELTQDIVGRGKAQAKERIRRLAGVADLEARKMILSAKQEVLEVAFQKAMEDLLNLPEDDYVNLLSRLTVDFAETGNGEMIFSQKDKDRFGLKVMAAAAESLKSRGVKSNLILSRETHQFRGGLLIKNGKVEINCSVEAMIRFVRDDLIKDVADILFAKPEN